MKPCPQCGHANTDTARFCAECGTPLAAAPAPDLPVRETISELNTIADEDTRNGDDRLPRGEPAILSVGTVFAGRYEITGVLGKGGMGVVYSARDRNMEEEIAIKLIRPDRLGGEGAMQRLVEEGRTARRISHPNIVRIFDVASHEGQPFVVMEKLAGKSLRAWHREQLQSRRDVPYKVAARIIAEILSGLSAAHKAGVVHRDLKPENVFLLSAPTETDARVRILDFGIATGAGTGRSPGTGSSVATTAGTMGYMAPEQEDNAHLAGPEADLFAVSVMFYELLMQNRPSARWKPPSGARPDVPRAVDALIEAGLSDYPKSRPQSADAYLETLSKASGTDWFADLKRRYQDQERKSSGFWAPILKRLGFDWKVGEPMPWSPRNLGLALVYGVVLAAVGGAINAAGSGGFPGEQGGYPGGGHEPPAPSPSPAPVRSGIDYSSLSGNWGDESSYWSLSVTGSGSVAGPGTDVTGSLQGYLSGQFDGKQLNFTVRWNNGVELTGSGTLINDNHVRFTLRGPGGQGGGGLFHINHTPH